MPPSLPSSFLLLSQEIKFPLPDSVGKERISELKKKEEEKKGRKKKVSHAQTKHSSKRSSLARKKEQSGLKSGSLLFFLFLLNVYMCTVIFCCCSEKTLVLMNLLRAILNFLVLVNPVAERAKPTGGDFIFQLLPSASFSRTHGFFPPDRQSSGRKADWDTKARKKSKTRMLSVVNQIN